ncbi:MAG: biotin/lipoyl-binding protein, partial [Terriglobales bacterium]
MTNLWRHFEVWRAAWQAQTHLPAGPAPRGRELDFLPAVLEIQESPPSPIGRAVTITIIAAVLVGILWATFGRVDIVAVAQGKIIPSGYSKVIQPLESGVITAIHVRNGQAVRTGEVLIELDPTISGADQERLVNELRAAKVDAARLRALLAGQTALDAPEGADPRYVALQQQRLRDQLAEHQARVEAAKFLVEERKAALEGTKADVARLEAIVPIHAQRVDAYQAMLAKAAMSKVEYMEAEEQLINKTQELAAQRQRLIQDTAALAEARQNAHALLSEFQQTHQAELTEA